MLPFHRCLSVAIKPQPYGRSISIQAQLYRVLLRQCRAYDKNSLIWLQPPIDPHTAGSARLWSTRKSNNTASIHAVYQWLVQQSPNKKWKMWYQELLPLLPQVEEKNDDSSDDSDTDDDDNNSTHIPNDQSLWTTRTTLQHALRMAFISSPSHYSSLALTAFRHLRQQYHQQLHQTSTHTSPHGIRVSVLSQSIGRSLEHKYRFAYRVRIENVASDTSHNDPTKNITTTAVQLLGRTWHIVEYKNKNNSSNNTTDDDEHETTIVDAPTTGAVGQLPVLHPNTCFEYISGAELTSKKGQMYGWFHFARVPVGTSSAVVGMAVPALRASDKFVVDIQPFPLVGGGE